MNIGDTISGCTVLGLAPAGDGESYILLLKQPGVRYRGGQRVQYITGRVGVRQLPKPTEWWHGTYSDKLEDAVKRWIERSCITDDTPVLQGAVGEGVKWLTRLIENTEKALAEAEPEPAPKVEIVHSRDPDSECEHTVFVGGKRVDAEIEDIDPGRGYDEESIQERRDEAEARATAPDATDFDRTVAQVLGVARFEKWAL